MLRRHPLSLPLSLRPAAALFFPLHLDHHPTPAAGAAAAATLTTSAPALLKQLPPRPKPPPDSEIEESFLKGSGPGGQKINKTNSAVQLKHLPTGIVVKSQATRSRSQNRKMARELLAARLDELARGAQSRTAVVSEVKRKRAASAAKKSRRKYRRLAEEGGKGEAAAAAAAAGAGVGPGLDGGRPDEEVNGEEEEKGVDSEKARHGPIRQTQGPS